MIKLIKFDLPCRVRKAVMYDRTLPLILKKYKIRGGGVVLKEQNTGLSLIFKYGSMEEFGTMQHFGMIKRFIFWFLLGCEKLSFWFKGIIFKDFFTMTHTHLKFLEIYQLPF